MAGKMNSLMVKSLNCGLPDLSCNPGPTAYCLYDPARVV